VSRFKCQAREGNGSGHVLLSGGRFLQTAAGNCVKQTQFPGPGSRPGNSLGRVASSRPQALAMVWRGATILALLFCGEGLRPSNRGQDARDTQGRDALATRRAIAKLRLTMPPMAQGTSQECYPRMRGIEPGHLVKASAKDKSFAENHLWQMGPAKSRGQTKPIGSRGPVVQTNPIPRVRHENAVAP